FDAGLNLQWQREYKLASGYVYQSANQIVQTSDGGFLFAGQVMETSDDNGNEAGYVQKIDNGGNAVWIQTYLGFNENEITGIAPSKDGNFVLLASTSDSQTGTNVLKITPDGATVLWTNQIGLASGNIQPVAIAQSSDGTLFYTGNVNNKQLLIGKLDANGNALWSKIFAASGQYNSNQTYALATTTDGGCIAGGSYFVKSGSFDLSMDTSYAFLTKLNSGGSAQWMKTFNGTNLDHSTAASQFDGIISTADGGFAASGTGYERDVNFFTRGLIYKFDNNSNICGDAAGSPSLSLNDAGVTASSITSGATALTAPSTFNTPFAINSSSEFFQISICSSVLPVQLLSFNATLQNKNVNVVWKTTNEVNTDHFTVERSSDTRNFAGLQTVGAKGNGSTSVESYAVTDFQPLTGTSYYRLKEVSKDGSVTYSNVVPVTVLATGTLVISPNPVYNNVRILLQSPQSANITFQVSDMSGKILTTQSSKVSEGINTITIPAASLSAGMYILKVIENNTVQYVKFIKR
ncbi:MAG: T9SS type A sorting domain-containing protein, partial [Bacteroidota bacterium]|nr:T9SS type A sorting domain-containing protein [Bacteroidota bacterium]